MCYRVVADNGEDMVMAEGRPSVWSWATFIAAVQPPTSPDLRRAISSPQTTLRGPTIRGSRNETPDGRSDRRGSPGAPGGRPLRAAVPGGQVADVKLQQDLGIKRHD